MCLMELANPLLIMLMLHHSMLYDIINSELLDEDYHFAMVLKRGFSQYSDSLIPWISVPTESIHSSWRTCFFRSAVDHLSSLNFLRQ